MSAPTPTHIGFAGRKSVIARLLAYEARARLAPDSRDDASEKVVNEMIDSANQAPTHSTSKPLDSWLNDAVEKAQTITEARWGPQSGTSAAAILDDLKSKAAGISCTRCAKGGSVCRGGLRDNQIVAADGQCLRHFFETYREASAIADSYYRTYAWSFVASPKLIISTGEAAKKPHDIPIAIFVGGETSYIDDGEGLTSAVELKVAIKSLDWQSWLAVLYVLLHELVCHAYAGTSDGRARTELNSFDPFAEGWMDSVCGMILEDVANNVTPAAGLVRSFKAERVGSGNRFRLQRELPVRDDGGMAWSVEQSVRAANRTFGALQRLLRDPARAREAMYRLSLDLNVLNRPVEVRAGIASMMSTQLAGPETRYYGSIIRLIKQYLRERSASALFDQLQDLTFHLTNE